MGLEFPVVVSGECHVGNLRLYYLFFFVFTGQIHLVMPLQRILGLPLRSQLLISHQTHTTLARILEFGQGDVVE